MQFASFSVDGAHHYGPAEEGMVFAVPSAERQHFPDLAAAIAGDALVELAAAARQSGSAFATTQIDFDPVIPRPGKIICVGLNYRAHGDEKGRPEHPAIFTRFWDTQIGHDRPLMSSTASTMFDYEGELAVIIGCSGRAIKQADALDHVAGYSCYNDATMRDWQRHSTQYTAGKNFPGTGAFGPYLVTADQVGDPGCLELTTRVEGMVVQQASTAVMLFSVPELIAYVSTFAPLAPGDVLVTGTPAGSGASHRPPRYLSGGALVEVEIERIGLLRNIVA